MAHLPNFWRGLKQHEPMKPFLSEVGRLSKAGAPDTTCVRNLIEFVIGG